MISINYAKFQEVFAQYKKDFPTNIGKEIYKWQAIKHFQDNWDIDAPDFIAMFWEATATFDNLLTSANHFPRRMVKEMYESEPETVKEMFRNLYDESNPLEERVGRFKSEADRIRKQYWPHKKHHYQDINSISTYLWARYPEKYYIYKYSEIRATTQILGSDYVVRKGAGAGSLSKAFEFFNLIRAEIQKDSDFRPILNAALTSDCYKGENLNCVVVDFDFYVSRYYNKTTPVINQEGKAVPARGVEIVPVQEVPTKYSDADFLSKVFVSPDKLSTMKHLLRRKKSIILQGPPGVGKTFCAKLLCYAMMEEKDDSRIEFVQFHQNYSYEDFIMGYKPDGNSFILRDGVFYEFCNKARKDGRDHFFIIDEINRGNISKVFGELLMLIEYRDKSARLVYTDKRFSIPSNVYILGLMNTADRSLAMIDYALRRRFSFVDMEPCFKDPGFLKYQESLDNDKLSEILKVIKDLNVKISDELGKGFEIGHSYFCELTKEECTDLFLKEVVQYDILPTLKEYWFDNQSEVERWEKKLMGIFND